MQQPSSLQEGTAINLPLLYNVSQMPYRIIHFPLPPIKECVGYYSIFRGLKLCTPLQYQCSIFLISFQLHHLGKVLKYVHSGSKETEDQKPMFPQVSGQICHRAPIDENPGPQTQTLEGDEEEL